LMEHLASDAGIDAWPGRTAGEMVFDIVHSTPRERIQHVAQVLHHAFVTGISRPHVSEAHRECVQELLSRESASARVELHDTDAGSVIRVRYPLPDPIPRVSILIPTRDRLDLLRPCVHGLLNRTDYAAMELIIVDNGSTETATLSYLNSLAEDSRVRVMSYDGEFNHSAINNRAAVEASGTILGILNNDLVVIHPDWLMEMVSLAVRDDVGAVGCKLLFPDNRIQHAGVVLGFGGVAGHVHWGRFRDDPEPLLRTDVTQEFSVVTAACLIVRRSVFEDVGGFDADEFPIWMNDVDLCLRIREAGFRNVWTPHATLYHRHSASLGTPTGAAERKYYQHHARMFRRRWGHIIPNDPFYNPNLCLSQQDCRPAMIPRRPKPWKS